MNSDYIWLTEDSHKFLKKDYLLPGQTVDQRVDIICQTAEKHLRQPGFADKFKSYIQRGYYSLSTPIWTNYGTDRGLPISCFGSHIGDSIESILDAHHEAGQMTKKGGGTSSYLGDIRPRGSEIKDNGTAFGPNHFISLFETLILTISQGSTRAGEWAGYLPLDHPDIMEFLRIRDDKYVYQKVLYGVCVSDAFMEAMIAGDQEKRKIWARVLECRTNKGLPYIFFTDNANNGAADVYRDKSLRINHSNLCTEIMLPDTIDESFVCDLSSMSILTYDEWKNTDAVETLVYFLDSVMTEFINKAEQIPFMHRAVKFAKRHRALGVGWVGYHSYLQHKMIPFESMQAKWTNQEVAKTIYRKAYDASAKLAKEFGEPELLRGYGRRNATLIAIAPTKSSAFIHGQLSEGIELRLSNYSIDDLQKGKYTTKNPQLIALLETKGMNTHEVWDEIKDSRGSVQNLDCLTAEEKEVYKTMSEVSPKEVVLQAAQRQKFIDQGQSLNLYIDPNVPVKDVNALLIEGWRSGLKSFYYQKSVNAAQQAAHGIMGCQSCAS